MTSHAVVKTEPAHIKELGRTMQQSDRDEVLAFNGHSPEEAVRSCVRGSSESWTWLADDKVVFIIGAKEMSLSSDYTTVWLLGSDLVRKYPRKFLMLTGLSADFFNKKYGTIRAFVDTRHDRAKRWLAWLGFDLHPSKVMGPSHMLFHVAERKVKNG